MNYCVAISGQFKIRTHGVKSRHLSVRHAGEPSLAFGFAFCTVPAHQC
jgi:hypothetical protein